MEKINLQIVSNGMDGEGIAKVDGKVYFVPGAVENDEVECYIIKENKNFCIAEMNKVLKHSEFRCDALCEHYGKCGGCNMQHIKYEKALQIKTNNVKNLFNKLKINAVVNNCIQSDKQFEYRNKLTMYLTKNNSLGFYEKNSNKLININKCCLVNEKFNKIIKLINNFLKLNKEFNSFVLKGISIRQINNYFIFNLILSKKINLTKLSNFLKLNKINFAIYYCINNQKNSNLPTYPITFFDGEEKIIIEEFGVKYFANPMFFMQVNFNVKTKIYNQIVSLVGPNEIVLDAYSGAGVLSATLAKSCKKVYAIEIDKSACEACKQIIKNNGIKNLISICGDCAVEIPKLLEKSKLDVVILDPARKGVDKNSIEQLIISGIKKIIYLSCNPATLARDIALLTTGGKYKVTYVQPYDMFPSTSEVETLCVLEKEE